MAQRNNEGWTIPDVIDPPESMEVTICIPKNIVHMKAFWGALWELTFWNNWAPDAAHSGTQVAAVWFRYYQSWQRQMSELDDCEGGMGKCCVQAAITSRVNPTTGLIEQSADNGATWQPSPNTFQSVIVTPVPPVTSGVAATKCDAATNLKLQIDAWITQVSNDFTTAESLTSFATAVAEAILAAVLVLLSAGTLTPIMALVIPTLGAALLAAWGAGKAAFDAYWTTELRDKILCAAQCSIGEDGSFTDAEFSQFWNKVNTDLPPAPAKMLLMGFLSSVGKEGLNAMAATGTSSGAECDCPCGVCGQVWEVGNIGGFVGFGTLISIDGDTYTFASQLHTDGVNYLTIKTPLDAPCCTVLDIVPSAGHSMPSAGTVADRIVCPNTQSIGNISNGGLIGQSVNYIGFNSSVAFQIEITFG